VDHIITAVEEAVSAHRRRTIAANVRGQVLIVRCLFGLKCGQVVEYPGKPAGGNSGAGERSPACAPIKKRAADHPAVAFEHEETQLFQRLAGKSERGIPDKPAPSHGVLEQT
jgi:hypothetical protein